VQYNSTGENFDLKVDRDALYGEGHELVGKLLHIMQVYKSAGAVDRAKKFYDQYSQVPEQMLKVRELMKKKKRASSLALYSNIELKDAKPSSATAVPKNQLSLNNYEEDLLGLINSF
jgi:dipeptidyl-peptidase-3